MAFDYTPLGSLLVQLNSSLLALDPETGQQLWSLADVVDSEIVPGMALFMARTSAGGAMRDLQSGAELWPISALGLSGVKGIVHIPARDFMLVYGETTESPYALRR